MLTKKKVVLRSSAFFIFQNNSSFCALIMLSYAGFQDFKWLRLTRLAYLCLRRLASVCFRWMAWPGMAGSSEETPQAPLASHHLSKNRAAFIFKRKQKSIRSMKLLVGSMK